MNDDRIDDLVIRKPYGARHRVRSVFSGVSLTKQSFKDSCDVNLIMKRFVKTGQLPQNDSKPFYGDFCSVGDYHTAMCRIIDSNAAFDRLDAKIRARFENDPAQLLAFLEDSANLAEAVELGICNPPVAKPDEGVKEVVDPSSAQ